MDIETVAGIAYQKPTVVLLQETGIGTSEIAARTCYDSFNSSENHEVKMLNELTSNLPLQGVEQAQLYMKTTELVNMVDHSDLLDTLAWTHFHHSILEHANLTYLIKGMSRGALQEQARHRIQAISVRSTRYTMQDVLHAFNSCRIALFEQAKYIFRQLIEPMDLFVVKGIAETVEINHLYEKLHHQLKILGSNEFVKLTMSKSALEVYATRTTYDNSQELFNKLVSCKSKRNVGDAFKWIITDNWKVDLVVTFNLRSLKNYLTLRDSGAAYFGIRWVAEAMKEATPSKYLDLIIKG